MHKPTLRSEAPNPRRAALLAASALAALATGATSVEAQTALHPFAHTGDVFVADAGSDVIVRLVDLNLDGDFDDPGEQVEFYSDVLGPFAWTNNNGLAFGANGTLYVADASKDFVYALRDNDFDGEANDAGETTVFFDGTAGGNQSGIVMTSSANLDIDAEGRLYVAVSNTSSGDDMILRLADGNADGDANDVGEAVVLYLPALGGAIGDSSPQDVVVGQDGSLLYVDGGTTGVIAKGVHRMVDGDLDGLYTTPGEVTPWFIAPTQAATPFYWAISLDSDGYAYLSDTGNDVIWRLRDENSDGSVTGAEAVLWYTSPGSSLIWKVVPATDGSAYAAESQNPDRILRLVDANNDGMVDPLDPLEVETVYSETTAPVAIGNPRSLALARKPTILVDPAPLLGSSTNYDLLGDAGDPLLVWWSTALAPAPLPIAPFGTLELAFLAPHTPRFLTGAFLDADGEASFNLTLPSNPALAGQTLAFQGVAGVASARIQFSNAAAQVLQ